MLPFLHLSCHIVIQIQPSSSTTQNPSLPTSCGSSSSTQTKAPSPGTTNPSQPNVVFLECSSRHRAAWPQVLRHAVWIISVIDMMPPHVRSWTTTSQGSSRYCEPQISEPLSNFSSLSPFLQYHLYCNMYCTIHGVEGEYCILEVMGSHNVTQSIGKGTVCGPALPVSLDLCLNLLSTSCKSLLIQSLVIDLYKRGAGPEGLSWLPPSTDSSLAFLT